MKIDDNTAAEWWMDHLAGNLSPEHKIQLDQYLSEHKVLAEELEAEAAIWERMGDLDSPAPSASMDQRFEAMLAGYQSASSTRTPGWSLIRSWFVSNWQVGLGALATGLIAGVFFINGPDQEVRSLSAEVQEMKKVLMLTMIAQPQAQDRIKAVNMASELSSGDSKVIEVLISTLNSDPSINVRLAALDALLPYGNQSEVREALVRSIGIQDSPLLQVALADAMIALKEKSAMDSFHKMITSDTVNESVKSKLKSTIETLRSI
ncbi:MAG: HEAT repeat domain-containing protein [Marinoscillum sp.]